MHWYILFFNNHQKTNFYSSKDQKIQKSYVEKHRPIPQSKDKTKIFEIIKYWIVFHILL